MRERGGDVKAIVIQSTEARTIQDTVTSRVEDGSMLCTDTASAYTGIGGYYHRTVNHSANQYVDGMAHTNGIESVWAVLKRGYYGIYHHFTVKHMQRYVNEFTFRLSTDGNCKVHTMDRIGALSDKSVAKHLTYKALIA